MTFTQKSATAFAVLLSSLVLLSTANAQGSWQFRGVDRSQLNSSGIPNQFSAEPLNRQLKDFYTDLEDSFHRNGPLGGSRVDSHASQLVAPMAGVPGGSLTGVALENYGLWNGGNYVVEDGKISGSGTASLGWFIDEGLGDDYLLEMSAVIAEGATARFGYLGEANSSRSINSDLSELGMSITRRSATELEWSVSWNMDDGSRQDFSSTLTTQTDTTNEAVRLQLGWEDVAASNNDLFDAWIETSEGNSRLLAGNMATSIDVLAIGLELEGEGVFATNFRAAVPEPTSLGLAFLAFIGLLGSRRRRS